MKKELETYVKELKEEIRKTESLRKQYYELHQDKDALQQLMISASLKKVLERLEEILEEAK